MADVRSLWAARSPSGDTRSCSPLDCFFYKNTVGGIHVARVSLRSHCVFPGMLRCFGQADCLRVPNCGNHVDRGFASVVVCSPTPGLAVFDPSNSVWTRVEDAAAPFKHVVVFPCMELQQLMAHCSGCDDASSLPIAACVHRVDKADVPRLSFNYELRSPLGVDVDDLFPLCTPAAAASITAAPT